ncbi:MAG: AAA family ATPase, partial [Pseudoclavibacter sp.]
MTHWRIRDFHPGDLDALLRIWEQQRRTVSEPVYALGEVIASTRKDTAVAAVVDDEVVGVAVARAAHDQG